MINLGSLEKLFLLDKQETKPRDRVPIKSDLNKYFNKKFLNIIPPKIKLS